MSEYEVLYRGVPVPDSVLAPNLFGSSLPAFKLGVDSAIKIYSDSEDTEEVPESEYWTYYVDEDDVHDPCAFFRRSGQNGESQFLESYQTDWVNDTEGRWAIHHYNYREVPFSELPDRVKNAGVLD